MKRKLLFAILGIAVTATAFGQGGIIFCNSLPDGSGNYHPILWPSATGGGVGSTHGIVLTFWYGEGVLMADQLVAGPVAEWNMAFEAAGYYGYYNPTLVVLPTWQPGDTFTFQLRASGTTPYGVVDPYWCRSILWQENANIAFIGGTPPGLPGEIPRYCSYFL